MAILSRGCGAAFSGIKGVAVAASAAPPTTMKARLVMVESFVVIFVFL